MRLYKPLPWMLGLVLVATAAANKGWLPVFVWPSAAQPVVRFSFSKFKESVSAGDRHDYTSEVTIRNLWNKKISKAEFMFYFYDKDRVRIGSSEIDVDDLGPGQETKFEAFIPASGSISSMDFVPRSLPEELQGYLPPKRISITVNSVPQGAEFKIDGTPGGTTPEIVEVAPGKHLLAFSKEGFSPGTFPLEITQNDVSGGSVSYELGSSTHDTLELRDGTVVSGDVLSMSATEVEVRVGGTVQHLNRNQVKRILLIPREPESQ